MIKLLLVIWMFLKSLWVLRPRSKPGLMTIVVIGETEMSKLQFKVNLPQPGADDVVERRFVLDSPNGKTDITLPGDALVVEGLESDEASELTLTLTDTDNAGNVGETRIQRVMLVDNIAPPMPGEMGVEVTGEGGVSVPVEETPEEPVSEEVTQETPADETPATEVADGEVATEYEETQVL